MKHFRIAVNGTSYDVEVTELDGAVSAAAAAATAALMPSKVISSIVVSFPGSRRQNPLYRGR